MDWTVGDVKGCNIIFHLLKKLRFKVKFQYFNVILSTVGQLNHIRLTGAWIAYLSNMSNDDDGYYT